MIRASSIGLIIVMLVASVGVSVQAGMYNGYETPSYRVVREEAGVQLREYEPHLVAEVTVRGSRDRAVNRGFRELAGYIFGENVSGQKVAMTSPVTQIAASEGAWTIRFMMPTAYAKSTLPAPNSQAIRFVETEAVRHVVLKFSGRWQDTNLSTHEADLRASAAKLGLQIMGDPIYHFYDGPFTLPWNRRNEVAFAVK